MSRLRSPRTAALSSLGPSLLILPTSATHLPNIYGMAGSTGIHGCLSAPNPHHLAQLFEPTAGMTHKAIWKAEWVAKPIVDDQK